MRKFVKTFGFWVEALTPAIFSIFLLIFMFQGLVYFSGYITLRANGFDPLKRSVIAEMQKIESLCQFPSCNGIEVQWYDGSWHSVLEVKRGKTLIPLGEGMIVSLELEEGLDVSAQEAWLLNGARSFDGKQVIFKFKNRGI